MSSDIEFGEAPVDIDIVAKPTRARAKGRKAPADAGGDGPRPVARIMQLVAALKAEQEAAAADALPVEPAERMEVMSSLREILVVRQEEQTGWEGRVQEMQAQLDAAQEALKMARIASDEAEAQHKRLVADLKLMHEHQRSIWTLERRRLEITVDALEDAREKSILAKLARLARPAMAAALLLAAAAGLLLAGDSGAAGGPAGVPRGHHLVIGGFQLD
jgi:hypothetical protein